MPTLEEIARLADVSRSTVSRVVNEDPNVNPHTRQRVQEVIRQLNYHPNRVARRLAGGKTHLSGLIIPMGVGRLFTDPFFPILIQAIAAACSARNYSIMLWLADPDYERRTMAEILDDGLLDGVVIASMLTNDPLVETLSNSHMPFVLIGRHPTRDCACYVDVDNYNAARNVTTHLLDLGRKRVATITGPQNMIAGLDRYEGYRAGLRERGIFPRPELAVDGYFTEQGGYEGVKALIPHRPDAIFAASDAMAAGALRALAEAGLRVPQDVAVIGFDDVPLAAHTNPPLTTVRQPIQMVGATAANALIDMIEQKSLTHNIILPTELVIRESDGASAGT